MAGSEVSLLLAKLTHVAFSATGMSPSGMASQRWPKQLYLAPPANSAFGASTHPVVADGRGDPASSAAARTAARPVALIVVLIPAAAQGSSRAGGGGLPPVYAAQCQLKRARACNAHRGCGQDHLRGREKRWRTGTLDWSNSRSNRAGLQGKTGVYTVCQRPGSGTAQHCGGRGESGRRTLCGIPALFVQHIDEPQTPNFRDADWPKEDPSFPPSEASVGQVDAHQPRVHAYPIGLC